MLRVLIIRKGVVKLKVEKLTTVCGSTIFVKLKTIRDKLPGQTRKIKEKPTPELVEEVNKKNSEKDLSIKFNYNYMPGDFHAVLTYAKEPTHEEAHKALDYFIRTCQKDFKKQGKIFKAVNATEYKHKRIHHHVVCSQMDLKRLREIWARYGTVRLSVLDDSRDYRRLAHYIIKETSKTFREPDAFSKRRFNCTRSIATPITKSEKVDASMLIDDPKAIDGYYIDGDSLYKGQNVFDGKPYMEYVMVANDAEAPRLITWKRGKPLKRKESNYSKWLKNNLSKQYEIDIPF